MRLAHIDDDQVIELIRQGDSPIRSAASEHAAHCPNCSDRLEAERSLTEFILGDQQPRRDPNLTDRVMRQIESIEKKKALRHEALHGAICAMLFSAVLFIPFETISPTAAVAAVRQASGDFLHSFASIATTQTSLPVVAAILLMAAIILEEVRRLAAHPTR